MRRTRLEDWICEVEDLGALDRETLGGLQLRRLNSLLAREAARGGFYRGLPERLGSLDELRSLPFTTPEQLSQNAPGLLLGSQAEVSRIISGATSGTTGPSKRIFYTARDLEHTVGFFAAGIGEMAAPGEAVAVAMPFSGPDGLGELICRAVERLGARPLRRCLQSGAETLIAKKLLSGDLGSGSTLVLDAENGELVCRVKQ